MAARTAVSDELARFLESGLSITAGACNDELLPDVVVVWAARVHDDRAHVSLFLHKEAARVLLESLRTHAEIAVLFDLPTSHRACQVKGVFTSTRSARSSERAEVQRQVDAFDKDLGAIGITNSMVTGWSIWPCAVIEFRVTQFFDQTPGPGAGEPLQ